MTCRFKFLILKRTGFFVLTVSYSVVVEKSKTGNLVVALQILLTHWRMVRIPPSSAKGDTRRG
jgi:hypothetical protein